MKAPKARNVKAWASGPGKRPTHNCQALKARNNSESEETYQNGRRFRISFFYVHATQLEEIKDITGTVGS